jgi:glycosyltransferase involved in cell wall biosynthesis
MKFLFFTGGWIVSGMETAFLSLMKGLAARGHQPTAIVSAWTDGETSRLLKEAGIAHHEVPLGRFYISNAPFTWQTLRRMPAARRQLRAIAQSVRPDWVIAPEAQPLLLSASSLRTRRALFLQSEPERLMRHAWAGRYLDRRLDRVLCCSAFIAACARATPVDSAKLAIVFNGVPLPAERPAAAQSGPVRIGIVGRLAAQKQHLVLLEAGARLKAEVGDAFRLDIVGVREGPFADALEARVAALGLGDRVRWTGFIADRDRLYGGLDIVAAPAIDEPFGLTVPEAGAYGLPVVAARSGAFPELVDDGRTGLLFAPGDARELAAALARLVGDPGLRQRLGRAAREHVAARFTIEAMTDSFLDALRPKESP